MLLHPWGFSRQDSWTGLPWLPPGDLPYPRIELASLMSPALAGGFFTTSATWEAPPWTKFMTRLLAGTWVLYALDLFDSLYGEKGGHAAMTDIHKFLPSRLSWPFFDFSLSTVEISKFVSRQVCMYVWMCICECEFFIILITSSWSPNHHSWCWQDHFFLPMSFFLVLRSFLINYQARGISFLFSLLISPKVLFFGDFPRLPFIMCFHSFPEYSCIYSASIFM